MVPIAANVDLEMDEIFEMDVIDEPTRFEHFPTETIFDIFDYLAGDDILKSFLYLNTRFDSLIKNFRLHTIDLSRCTRNEIITLFKSSFDHISTYSLSLKLANKIFNNDYCCANIELIFSLLMDSNQLKCLSQNLQQLIFIRPIIDTTICFPDILLQSFIIYSSNDRIIFKKKISQKNVHSIIICSKELMRSLLVDNGGIYNQILVNFDNPVINQIVPFVQHLKLYIDNYDEQWHYMSPLIVDTIAELTLLIIDNQFEYYNGQVFSSLLQNISTHCRLYFYLQVRPESNIARSDIDILAQSFQNAFYIQHQSNVTIAYCPNIYRTSDGPLLIYTSPFCGSKLKLSNNQEIVGDCSDYSNLTELVLDPYFPNNAIIQPLNNQMTLRLPNLTSLEFIHTSLNNFNQMIRPLNNLSREITSQIRRLHFRHYPCSFDITEYILPFGSFNHVRYLDITDNDCHCPILHHILRQNNFCATIFHLNISGLCRLQNYHIKDIRKQFPKLQTLKFSIKFISSFNEQLDTIGRFILVDMRTHLRYLHIIFEKENLFVTSMTPTEIQLSEWLGHNGKRFLHVQAIELNRNELSAWM